MLILIQLLDVCVRMAFIIHPPYFTMEIAGLVIQRYAFLATKAARPVPPKTYVKNVMIQTLPPQKIVDAIAKMVIMEKVLYSTGISA